MSNRPVSRHQRLLLGIVVAVVFAFLGVAAWTSVTAEAPVGAPATTIDAGS
jgi:hypothetical protein